MSSSIRAIRGMNDILPEEVYQWNFFEATIRNWLSAYGYCNIRTPIGEQTDLFVRSIGTATDIVEKEMYTFVDHLNGESLTLRPEGTASCVRAVLEHSLLYAGPQRLYYYGPMFRHVRPQKGRYRQFHQVGVEAIGYANAEIDAELIIMCARLWRQLGISNLRLEIGTLGSVASRAVYRDRLIGYFEQHLQHLDEDARRRLYTNPLRILDSKNPAMREVILNAPRLLDDLDEESLVHFKELQDRLRCVSVTGVDQPAVRIPLMLEMADISIELGSPERALEYLNETGNIPEHQRHERLMKIRLMAEAEQHTLPAATLLAHLNVSIGEVMRYGDAALQAELLAMMATAHVRRGPPCAPSNWKNRSWPSP